MEYNGYEVKWTDSRKNITYTTPDGHKCCDDKMNGLKYLKEMMEYEFRIRQEICCRNAGSAERYDLESGSGAAYGRRHGAVPADADAGSAEHYQHNAGYDEIDGTTGWENERGIWESHLAGAGTDEAYFEEAVLDLDDPQPDLGGLGTDAAYLAAGLTNIIDEHPVEDCTTKHYRPERKKRHGQTMGGM